MSARRIVVDRGEELNRRRQNGDWVDVTFKVGDEKIRAHRFVVSMFSPFLRALLNPKSLFVESSTDEIVLRGLDFTSFRDILTYMYTGKIMVNDENVFNLIQMCSYLQLEDGLMDNCSEFLKNKLKSCDVEEFIDIWNASSQFSLSEVKLSALQFMTSRFQEFLKDSSTLLNLDYGDLYDIVSNPKLCVRNEHKLLQMLINWLVHNLDSSTTTQEMALDIILKCDISLFPLSYVAISLDFILPREDMEHLLKKSLNNNSGPIRECQNCIYLFQYKRDRSEFVGIEEFISKRADETNYACLDLGRLDQEIILMPEFTTGKSYFQHYGPQTCSGSIHLDVDNRMAVLGGTMNSAKATFLSNDIRLFEFEGNTWIPNKSVIPLNLAHFCVEVLNGHCYFFGGTTDCFSKTSDTEEKAQISFTKAVYRIEQSKLLSRRSGWEILPDLPQKRTFFSSAKIGDKIYLIGANFCDIFDSVNLTWESLENVPRGIGRLPGLTVVGSKIFVFGNRLEEGPNQFLALETVTRTWQILPKISLRQDVIDLFSHNNMIYLIGWQTAFSNALHCYDIKNKSWSCLQKNMKGTISKGLLIHKQYARHFSNVRPAS